MTHQADLIGTVRFTLRVDKKKKDGKAPIELIYSLHGHRKRINTRLDIFPCQWDADNQQAFFIPKKESKAKAPEVKYNLLLMAGEVQAFNVALLNWRERVRKAEYHLTTKKKPFSSTDLIDYLKEEDNASKPTKKEEPRKLLADFIDFHLVNTKATTSESIKKQYKTIAANIREYEKKKRTRVTFADADYAFMQSFYSFCVETKKYVNPTSVKKIACVKNMLNVAAVKYGYEVNPTYKNFTVRRDNLEVIALTQKEFEAILELDLSKDKKLERVRDIFVFSCVTGLRFSDMRNLKRENIKGDHLRLTVKKTGEILEIPLTAHAFDVLAKYSNLLTPLPMISNQKFNDYIKTVCKLAEINEPVEIVRFRGKERVSKVFEKWELVTAHTGRKSFVTLSLAGGMPTELIMEVSGHRSYASFKRYVNITKEQKVKAMIDIWGKAKMKVAK